MEKVDKIRLKYSIIFPAAFVLLLWVIRMFEQVLGLNFAQYGVLPRSIDGLLGIFLSPLIHDPSDFNHLISNSIPLLVLGIATYYFYPRVSFKLFAIVYVLHGILVWIFARQVIHIGASGLVYGFTAFLFFNGLLRWDRASLALSLVVLFLYGGMAWGVFPLPSNLHISWEAHLFGSLAGILCAAIFWKVDLPPRKIWDDDDDLDDDNPYWNEEAQPTSRIIKIHYVPKKKEGED